MSMRNVFLLFCCASWCSMVGVSTFWELRVQPDRRPLLYFFVCFMLDFTFLPLSSFFLGCVCVFCFELDCILQPLVFHVEYFILRSINIYIYWGISDFGRDGEGQSETPQALIGWKLLLHSSLITTPYCLVSTTYEVLFVHSNWALCWHAMTSAYSNES